MFTFHSGLLIGLYTLVNPIVPLLRLFFAPVTFSILLASFVCGGRYSDLFRNYPRYISFLLIWFKRSISGGYPSLYTIIAVLFFVITAKMSLGYQKNIRRHVFDYMVAYAFPPPNFVINISLNIMSSDI